SVGVDELFDRGDIGCSRTPEHRQVIRLAFGHGSTLLTPGTGALVNRYSVAVSGQPQTGPAAGRARIANLANILTLLRLVLGPIFLLAMFAGGGHETPARITAFVIFTVACITDRLDGLLARNYGMATEFGAFADSIPGKMQKGSDLVGL